MILEGIAQEWNEVKKMKGGETMFQNKKDSRVFKNGKDGREYFIEAIVFNGNVRGKFSGSGCVFLNGEKISSTQYIKAFPFEPKTFIVDVISRSVWDHSIKDELQLKEVFDYYDKLVSEN